jgi:hypothetical protein
MKKSRNVRFEVLYSSHRVYLYVCVWLSEQRVPSAASACGFYDVWCVYCAVRTESNYNLGLKLSIFRVTDWLCSS